MATERFVTIASIQPCELGQVFEKLPRHITLCPPFEADPALIDTYHDRMREVMEENPGGVCVLEAEPARFGTDNSLLADKTWMTPLSGGLPIHFGAFVGAQEIGAVDSTHAGLNWNPHSTRADGIELRAPFRLRESQLVHYQPAYSRKRVIGVYAAGGVRVLPYEDWLSTEVPS